MTENEVIKIFENEVIILDCWIEHCKDIIADCETEEDEFDDDKERAELSLKDYTERKEAFDVAISALKEIQLYREIGTVEYFKKLKLADNGTIWGFIDEYVVYKNIGTVEECREAVEKQKPKKIVYESESVFSNGFSHYRMGKCPMCNKYYNSNDEVKYCPKCGQAIKWENLEEMKDD